jgi:hypothetical protein
MQQRLLQLVRRIWPHHIIQLAVFSTLIGIMFGYQNCGAHRYYSGGSGSAVYIRNPASSDMKTFVVVDVVGDACAHCWDKGYYWCEKVTEYLGGPVEGNCIGTEEGGFGGAPTDGTGGTIPDDEGGGGGSTAPAPTTAPATPIPTPIPPSQREQAVKDAATKALKMLESNKCYEAVTGSAGDARYIMTKVSALNGIIDASGAIVVTQSKGGSYHKIDYCLVNSALAYALNLI